jgi:hypothetical protein
MALTKSLATRSVKLRADHAPSTCILPANRAGGAARLQRRGPPLNGDCATPSLHSQQHLQQLARRTSSSSGRQRGGRSGLQPQHQLQRSSRRGSTSARAGLRPDLPVPAQPKTQLFHAARRPQQPPPAPASASAAAAAAPAAGKRRACSPTSTLGASLSRLSRASASAAAAAAPAAAKRRACSPTSTLGASLSRLSRASASAADSTSSASVQTLKSPVRRALQKRRPLRARRGAPRAPRAPLSVLRGARAAGAAIRPRAG